MPISIRPAQPQDAELLHRMIADLARYEREPDSVKVTASVLRKQLSEPQPPFGCVIMEIDNAPAGFALYFFAYSTWEGTPTLYLEDLFVYPQYRGQGAGLALMSHLAQTAEDTGCKRFEWSVLNWNEPAISFYENLGAQPMCDWTRYRLDRQALSMLAQRDLATV